MNITQLRINLLHAFQQSKRPLSIVDLKKIKSMSQVNESSLYRNLIRFEQSGIIRAVPSSGDFQFYEIIPADEKHHHHISCVSCHKVSCLPICELEEVIDKMVKKSGFILDGHSLELFGHCSICTTDKANRERVS